MQTHTVEGGGGLRLHVREWGSPTAPAILLIHGWSQNHLCWSKQFESALVDEFRVVAMDLRGHGQSDAPLEAACYNTGAKWADDVAAVADTLDLGTPVLVGWSYGGFVVGDYLRKYGEGKIAGVNLVGGAVGIGPDWFGSYIGPGFLEHAPAATSLDQTVALKAIQAFLHACIVMPVAAEDAELAMGWNMLVQPQVRGMLIDRNDDFRPEYSKLTKPLLVTYGGKDTVILPAMAKAIRDCAPASRQSEFEGAGHAPFLEDPARFNAELAAFSRQAFAGS